MPNANKKQVMKKIHFVGEYVCSLKWIGEGNYLAVGTSNGEVVPSYTVGLTLFLDI